MSTGEFPLDVVTPNMMSAEQLAAGYTALHDLDIATYHHTKSGLRLLWKYDDVNEALRSEADGISKRTSLDPLGGYGHLMKNVRVIRPFVSHLLPPPAQATANAPDPVRHKVVWDAMYGQEGYFRIRDKAAAEARMVAHFDAAFDRLGDIRQGGGIMVDVSGQLAPDFASRMVADWVGLKPEDAAQVEGWSRSQSGLLGRFMTGKEQAMAVEGLGSLFSASRRIVRARRHPADRNGDLASHVLNQGLSRREAVSVLANCLAAGVMTVSGTIDQGVHALLSDPSRTYWEQLGDEQQAALTGKEVVRMFPGLAAWKGEATKEVQLKSGTVVPKGKLLLMLQAANRDPAVYDDPHAFEPGRRGALPLSFGAGAHTCPGQKVARMGIDVFLRELYQRVDNAALLPPAPDRLRAVRPDLLFNDADVRITGRPRRAA